MLTHFSLFTGIGGIDLAAEQAGFVTVGQCELDDYPYQILCKHWPSVPKWRNIRNVTAENVQAAGIQNITLVSGGFPCQPFSTAGKRRGKDDNRYLWPEMFRVVKEIRPTWVLGENVAGFVNLGLDDAVFNLETEGYEVQPFIIPACAVGAPHRRDRVFIVAYANSSHGGRRKEIHQKRGAVTGVYGTSYTKDVADTVSHGLEKQGLQNLQEEQAVSIADRDWWKVEPGVGRVVDGIPHRVDRLKCLGNAVVPYQVYPILKAIADIEKGTSYKE